MRSDLSLYYHYEPRAFNEGVFSLQLYITRPTIFDPIEILIRGDKVDSEYRYAVEVVHSKRGKLFSTTLTALRPWDILDIRTDFTGEQDLREEMKRTVHPFQVRLKNNSWRFEDCKGRGITRAFNSTLRCFWADSEESLFEALIVQCWQSLDTQQLTTLDQFRNVAVSLLKIYVDHLLEASRLEREIEAKGVDRDALMDQEFMHRFLQEVRTLVKILAKPYIEGAKLQLRQLLDQPAQPLNAELENGLRQMLSSLDTLNLLGDAVLDERSLEKLREDLSSLGRYLYTVLPPVPANLLPRVQTSIGAVVSQQADAQRYGLVWRTNLFFFNLFKRSFFNRLIAGTIPKYRAVDVSRVKTAGRGGCYYWGWKDGYEIRIVENCLEYRGRGREGKVTMPTLAFADRVKVSGDRVYLSLKERGIQNWGMHLYSIDLGVLRKGGEPKIVKVKSYDALVSYSGHRDNVCLFYVKGFIGYVGLVRIGQNQDEHPTVLAKMRELLGQCAAEGDPNPGMKRSKWRHMTCSCKLFGETVYAQMTNHEEEEVLSQRLFTFKCVGNELKPVGGRYMEHPLSYFEGRRVEPRHQANFMHGRTAFSMLCSDRLNYHLSVFVKNQWTTVRGWARQKSILRGWEKLGGKKAVYTSYDEKHKRLCLYALSDKWTASTQGLIVMQVRLKF